MRVLLSTIGSRGDVQPLVALALALRARGQEVRLCVPPDFRGWLEDLALPVTPIGPELRGAMARMAASPPTPEERRRMAEASVAGQFATIAEAARGCDLVVAASALQIAARSVAESMGIRYVFAAYCPIVLPSSRHAPPPLPVAPPADLPAADNRELWARDATRFAGTFGEALASHRASLGLPPVDDVRAHVFTDRPWLAADPTLAPWPEPEDGAVIQTGAWIWEDERPLSPELESFLDAGTPPVFFGFGSMRAHPDLAREMVTAARAVGRRAVLSRGWADLSHEGAGPDVMTIGEVNVRALFPRVAAVVHHGGAGTTTAAELAGAPQVVVPQIYDQHYWAKRVRQLGVGTAHAPGRATAESLTVELVRVLEPAFARRAGALASAIRRDGADEAARRLVA
ncbi:MAG: glycosyltransferase [Vicinamibacteria bacterium]